MSKVIGNREIMGIAWRLAETSALAHKKGTAKEYFAESLKAVQRVYRCNSMQRPANQVKVHFTCAYGAVTAEGTSNVFWLSVNDDFVEAYTHNSGAWARAHKPTVAELLLWALQATGSYSHILVVDGRVMEVA